MQQHRWSVNIFKTSECLPILLHLFHAMWQEFPPWSINNLTFYRQK